jgi:hypothetical protein
MSRASHAMSIEPVCMSIEILSIILAGDIYHMQDALIMSCGSLNMSRKPAHVCEPVSYALGL